MSKLKNYLDLHKNEVTYKKNENTLYYRDKNLEKELVKLGEEFKINIQLNLF